MLRVLIALLVACELFVAPTKAQPRPVSPVDMVELPRLTDGALSPDGTMLAYLRSETDWAEDETRQRLRLISVDTGEHLPVPEMLATGADAMRIWWHRDSRRFIFLRKPDGESKHQVFAFDLDTLETEQLTDHSETITGALWQPDGLGFYFTAAEQQSRDASRLLRGGWVIPPFEADANREIWQFDLSTRTARPVVQGRFSVRQVRVTRDGGQLVYSRLPNHKLDVGHFGEVFTSAPDGEQRTRWTQNFLSEVSPQVSPDGTRLAYIAYANADGEPFYEAKVFVKSPDGAPQRLLDRRAMEALDFAWDQTGEGIYILVNTGLSADLYHYTLATGTLRQLTSGQHDITQWTYLPSLNAHLLQIESAANPGEFFILRDPERGPEQITSEFTDWTPQFVLPRQERVSWRGRRGVTIEGLLIYPVGYQHGQRYPLVTVTHGGPHTSARFGNWSVNQYLPVLAGQGYMVLLPNHRGSTGYGDDFMRDMAGRYFRNAHHDVMDGVDALIERGLADPDRLIKMGWSAGGHMVNKLITHTRRFKAASSGAGAADWLSLHGESDIRYPRLFVFEGEPWQRQAPRRRYRQDSPLRDVWKVTTPTLFFAGGQDVRVPPTQSILMYRGVQATGTPTILYQAVEEGHTFRDPTNKLFKINAELGWFAHFALGEDYEDDLPAEAYVSEPEPPQSATLSDAANAPSP